MKNFLQLRHEKLLCCLKLVLYIYIYIYINKRRLDKIAALYLALSVNIYSTNHALERHSKK